jgi:tRNA-splicing ligase RtcB
MENYNTYKTKNVEIKAWTKGVQLEEIALQQLYNTAELPIVYKHIAVMPDVHWGLGATIGSVIPTKEAIIPAAVGVDIGCGMCAIRTSLTSHDLPDNLGQIRNKIERDVPVGFEDFRRQKEVSREASQAWNNIFYLRHKEIVDKHPKLHSRKDPMVQLGTLGGGNHFIEICLDEQDRVWVMLHSGSRNVGNRIGMYFISKAKKEMERLGITLTDKNLAYLKDGSELFYDYVDAVSWAQEYARINRKIMLETILNIFRRMFKNNFTTDKKAVNCHHNYVQREEHFGENLWITRKGAVSAMEGQLGIIPGSMGTCSYIVEGKGNPESFHSCAHGAGRSMGRKQAKKIFTIEDHIKATEGVECRKDKHVLDETPGAYKDINGVINAQTDLINILYKLKQIICVKG